MNKPPGQLITWLSYIMDWPVVTLSSTYNPLLKIVFSRGRYKLITEGAIYSFGDLYSNFRKSFEQLKWEDHPVKSCLVLGLGLASIPDMLVHRFKKDIRFTAVEIDEEVIRLAYEYVISPKKLKVQVFTSDAASFLEWHEEKYDLICSDVFEGDRIPSSLETIESLQAMRDLLNPGGILIYNRLSRYKSDITRNLKFQEDVFLKVFPEGGFIDVTGNWMYVSPKTAFNQMDTR
jgi:SAM-dependent methyltransferase